MGRTKLKLIINSFCKRHTVEAAYGRRLKDIISDLGIDCSLPCGGMGRCGKCAVRFSCGAPKPNSLDMSFLTQKEIEDGYRLLCRCIVENDCEVFVDRKGTASEEDIVAEGIEADPLSSTNDIERFGIAIDIGTTTVAAALVGKKKDKDTCFVLDSSFCVNHQRQYGADVISRIDAASDAGVKNKLQELIRADIRGLIEKLLGNIPGKEITDIVLSGNATMIHLLRGYDVSGLGKYPYRVDNIGFEETDLTEVLGVNLGICAKAHILPGISAFVGGDIVSGLYYLNIPEDKEKALFIDLGTNGEMAYYNEDTLTVTSTAAGPVFEGGGISCGVASVPGAICHVDINDKAVEFETIGQKAPIGLCGTGVIEVVAELRRNGIISSEGLLSEEFFEKGFVLGHCSDGKTIIFTQKDIRNVQLAKAAINTGMRELLAEDEPDVIYMAGGFGSKLAIQKIRELRLFSDDYYDKINLVGNSSLKGCVKYLEAILLGKENSERMKITEIAKEARECVLAKEESFGEDYVAALGF